MHSESLDPLKESLLFKQTNRGPFEPPNICDQHLQSLNTLATVIKIHARFSVFHR